MLKLKIKNLKNSLITFYEKVKRVNDSRNSQTLFKYSSTLNHWTFTCWLRMKLLYFRRSFFATETTLMIKVARLHNSTSIDSLLNGIHSLFHRWMQTCNLNVKMTWSLMNFFIIYNYIRSSREYGNSGFYFGWLLLYLLALLHHHKSAPSFWSNNSERWKDFSLDEPSRRCLMWKHKNVGSVFKWLLLTAILFWEFTGPIRIRIKESFRVFLAFSSAYHVYNLMKRYICGKLIQEVAKGRRLCKIEALEHPIRNIVFFFCLWRGL